MNNLKAIIEGLLFVSGDEGLSVDEIVNISESNIDDVKNAIKILYKDYETEERGIQLEYLGERFKLTTKPTHKEYYKKLLKNEEDSVLSQSALETLAIIAYNSPITRIDIDNIRGVNSTYVIRKLLIKGLIEEVGRSDSPGKPRLYNITPKFLDYFGLGSIEELPQIETNEIIENEEKSLFASKYTDQDNNKL